MILDTSAVCATAEGVGTTVAVTSGVNDGTDVGIETGVPEGGGWVTRTVVFTAGCVGDGAAGAGCGAVHPAVITTAHRRATQRDSAILLIPESAYCVAKNVLFPVDSEDPESRAETQRHCKKEYWDGSTRVGVYRVCRQSKRPDILPDTCRQIFWGE